jgi:hypothetical protein
VIIVIHGLLVLVPLIFALAALCNIDWGKRGGL